jgi:glycerate kinase
MGAAGGIAFGLKCAGYATLIPGAELVAAWLDLDRHLADCDVVLTGEGRFDLSSLHGKGPGDLLRRAAAMGKNVFVLAGSSMQNLPVPHGVKVLSISPSHLPLSEALNRGAEFLSQAVTEIIPQLEK